LCGTDVDIVCALRQILIQAVMALPTVVETKSGGFWFAKIVFIFFFVMGRVVRTGHLGTHRRSIQFEHWQEKACVGGGWQSAARRRCARAKCTGTPPSVLVSRVPARSDFSPRPRTPLTMYSTTLGAGGASRLAPWARKGLVSGVPRTALDPYKPQGHLPRPAHVNHTWLCLVTRIPE
jgi:hypothetical protein